jgi:hypothetical protein
MDTPVADAAGIVESTVGGTSAAAVVNVQTVLLASAVPSTSVIPVVTVAVYVVLDASGLVGASVATSFA